MANTFKNAYLDITNSAQTIYTAPASTTSIVLTLRITNVDGTNNDTITADVIDTYLETHELLIQSQFQLIALWS